jgi:hypothetical protein
MGWYQPICPIIGNQVDDANVIYPCISTVMIDRSSSASAAGSIITKFEMVSNNHGVVYTSTSSISGNTVTNFDNISNAAFGIGDVITVTYEIVGFTQPPGTTYTDLCMDAVNVTDNIGLFPGAQFSDCVLNCTSSCLGIAVATVTFTVQPGKSYEFYPNVYAA